MSASEIEVRSVGVEGVGRRLAEARRQKALTQYDVADLVGVRVATVSLWERGVNCPTLGRVAVLARLYGVSADWLIGLEPRPPESESEAS